MTPAESRAEINRANSQHSTGPKTPEGKKRISLNALRHGLTGQIVVMAAEDLEAYKRHFASFVVEYNPKGASEANLVQALADASWRLNRVAALETNLLTLTVVSAPEAITGAVSMAAAIDAHSRALSNLSMHSQRLSRQFERTLTQLRELQKIRRAQEQKDLNMLLDIMEMSKSKGETYHPSADGFVFSEPEIAAALRARNRDRRALEAFKHQRAAA